MPYSALAEYLDFKTNSDKVYGDSALDKRNQRILNALRKCDPAS